MISEKLILDGSSGLQVKDLAIRVPGKTLLTGVSFQLESASVMAVIGPNGAGKTTLLQAVGGELRPEQGSIHWCGLHMAALARADKAQRLAFMPQLTSLPFPFTAEEVVRLGRLPHAAGIAQDKVVVRQVMSLLDVLHLRDRIYTRLSGGEKQRVQLARAMAQVWDEEARQPRLLLLDEPSSALDIGHQQQLLAALAHLKKQNVAILMAVHDLNLAACADQILALKSGTQLCVGSTDDVLTGPNLSELFNAPLQVIYNRESAKPVVVALP